MAEGRYPPPDNNVRESVCDPSCGAKGYIMEQVRRHSLYRRSHSTSEQDILATQSVPFFMGPATKRTVFSFKAGVVTCVAVLITIILLSIRYYDILGGTLWDIEIVTTSSTADEQPSATEDVFSDEASNKLPVCNLLGEDYENMPRISGVWRPLTRAEIERMVGKWPVLFSADDDFFACHQYDPKKGKAKLGSNLPKSDSQTLQKLWVDRLLELNFTSFEGQNCQVPQLDAEYFYRLLADGRPGGKKPTTPTVDRPPHRTLYLFGDSLQRMLGRFLYRLFASIPQAKCMEVDTKEISTVITCSHPEFGDVVIRRQMAGVRYGSTLSVGQGMLAIPKLYNHDIVLGNTGLHFPLRLAEAANKLNLHVSAFFESYKRMSERYLRKPVKMPYVIWQETTPQHFKTEFGDGQFPPRDTWYDYENSATCLPHNYSVPDARKTANHFNDVFYTHLRANEDFIKPLAKHRKFAVVRLWEELLPEVSHVCRITPHSWSRGCDCTHYCSPSGAMVLMARLLQTTLTQMVAYNEKPAT